MNATHNPRDELGPRLAEARYVAGETLVTALSLALDLGRPLLLEGEAGVGKTEVAKALAAALDTRLIRLQCYEGLDATTAIYEWNYQRQLLAIKASERENVSAAEAEAHVFSERYLLRRPLLEAIGEPRPCVLLIDEIDRADEEFEAYLLEVLSDFQITVPEIGTIAATSIPHVILTSNGTRELSDALRRRCLYCYVEFPSMERELAILRRRLPGSSRPSPRRSHASCAACGRRTWRNAPGWPRPSTGPARSWVSASKRCSRFEAPACDPHLSAQDRGGSQVGDARGVRASGRARGVSAGGVGRTTGVLLGHAA